MDTTHEADEYDSTLLRRKSREVVELRELLTPVLARAKWLRRRLWEAG